MPVKIRKHLYVSRLYKLSELTGIAVRHMKELVKARCKSRPEVKYKKTAVNPKTHADLELITAIMFELIRMIMRAMFICTKFMYYTQKP